MAKVAKVAKRRGGAKPGERRGGRGKGTPNKVSVTLKQSVLDTFEKIGGPKHMATWAKKNPSDFYRIAAKLIPPGTPVRITGLTGTLAQQATAVVTEMASGVVTPEEASTIMQVIAAQARVVEVDDLDRRIRALETERKEAHHAATH